MSRRRSANSRIPSGKEDKEDDPIPPIHHARGDYRSLYDAPPAGQPAYLTRAWAKAQSQKPEPPLYNCYSLFFNDKKIEELVKDTVVDRWPEFNIHARGCTPDQQDGLFDAIRRLAGCEHAPPPTEFQYHEFMDPHKPKWHIRGKKDLLRLTKEDPLSIAYRKLDDMHLLCLAALSEKECLDVTAKIELMISCLESAHFPAGYNSSDSAHADIKADTAKPSKKRASAQAGKKAQTEQTSQREKRATARGKKNNSNAAKNKKPTAAKNKKPTQQKTPNKKQKGK